MDNLFFLSFLSKYSNDIALDLDKNLFLNTIFHNEDIPYLIKKYDSRNDGYNYHVKVFEINYKLLPKK